MKVFVAGGTGFVGQELVSQLLNAGNRIRCLVRRGSEHKLTVQEGVEIHYGDATDPASLDDALAGCDALINLVGIIREFPGRGITFERLHVEVTRNLVMAAQIQGVDRFVQMSANGAGPDGSTAYHRTKWQAEEAVRGSGLEWTIFRPSLIFGPDDEFVNLLAAILRKVPVIPVIGDGEYRLTPVAVEDVATGFVRSLERPESYGQAYYCGGPQTFTYNEIVDMIAAALNRKALKIPQPPVLLRPVVALLEGIPQFPLTRTQMTMLLEGNECDPTPWAEAFDLKLKSFEKGIRSYLDG